MTLADRNIATWLAVACLLGSGCDGGTTPTGEERLAPALVATDLSDLSEPAGSPSASPSPARGGGSPAKPVESYWPPGPLDISFDDIKFEMRKDEPFLRTMLTSQIEQLDGRDIRIRGYILPSFQQRGITQFVLVRDNLQCCFGPGAALFDCILVEMQPGRSTSFSVRPVKVDGTFSIREFKDPDGKHLAIFHLSGREVN